MDDLKQKINELLASQDLTEIENEIADKTLTHVNRDNIDILKDLLKKEVEDSKVELDELSDQIKNNKTTLINFGAEFIKEYKTQEKNPNVTAHLGLAVGFSISYSIYLYYLTNKHKSDLLEYIKRRRIPNPRGLQQILIKAYENSINKS